MSADLYRVISLAEGKDETPCEAAFTDVNAVLSLFRVGQIFSGQLTPGTGFALYRPISGDGTLFGIALADQQPVNAQMLEALKIARESITESDIDDLAFIDDVIAKADGGKSPQLTKVAEDVIAERQRQISAECWTPEHDDEHTCGELVQAAADLCLYGTDFRIVDLDGGQMIGWGLTERHRDDRRRQLVIAGALILAEIERLDRAAAKGGAA